ncbi:MAG: protein kinase family protein, partial [Micrococcales bacterium]|nr:protein kinase family protein [Micrococcales bacterium]
MSLAVLPTRVAGFRVTRALARDDRADLLLVRDDGSVALVAKVFRPGVERAAVDRELAALARGAHRHVLPLLDAGCTSDGAVVGILRHLPCGSLARWLEGRELVSAGEAVTILAPLADAVRTLHGRGVAHGRLASSRVLFDADGAPVLTGFGAAVLFGSDAPPVLRERIPEVAADLDALRGIADAVLGHVTGAGARRAAELRADLAGVPTDEVAALLVDGLFSFAAGSPIRFADSGADLPASAAARAPTVAAAHEVAEPERRRPSPRVPAGQPVAVLLERGPVSVAASALRARWRSIDAGRRRIVVGLVAASAAAAVAMVLVPSGAGGSSRADESPEGALAPAPASSPRVTP